MNIMQIMKQAQNVQAKLKESQKQLADMELMGEAGSGAVKIICDGQGKFKSIKLDSEALSISSENAEELEDLISANGTIVIIQSILLLLFFIFFILSYSHYCYG